MAKKKKLEDRNPRQWMEIDVVETIPFNSIDETGDKSKGRYGLIQLVSYLISTQPQFTLDLEGLRSGVRIEIALRGKTNDDALHLEWQEIERLQAAAKKPRNGYQVSPPLLVLPMVEADIKKRARLNCIRHFLNLIPYEDLTPAPINLPPRTEDDSYERPPIEDQHIVPDRLD